MLIKKPDPIKPSQITDRAVWEDRRRLLKAAAAAGIACIELLCALGIDRRKGDVHGQTIESRTTGEEGKTGQ